MAAAVASAAIAVPAVRVVVDVDVVPAALVLTRMMAKMAISWRRSFTSTVQPKS